jgi:DNA-binding MarR family transcriptional regulator
MRLEDEIKQREFTNPYQKLMINILYTGSWLNLIESNHLKSYGLTLPQYNVLRILRGQFPNPTTINDIIDRMLDKSSNASRIVDKLVLKKYVDRKVCEKDKRAVDVLITQKGKELLAEIDKRAPEWEERFKTLTSIQATKVNFLLDKLRDSDIYSF